MAAEWLTSCQLGGARTLRRYARANSSANNRGERPPKFRAAHGRLGLGQVPADIGFHWLPRLMRGAVQYVISAFAENEYSQLDVQISEDGSRAALVSCASVVACEISSADASCCYCASAREKWTNDRATRSVVRRASE